MNRKGLQVSPTQIAAWQGRIKSGWQKSVSGIIETAKVLQDIHTQAKKVHGSWKKVFEGPGKPSFGADTARMMIKIAENRVLTNPKYTSRLPACWYSLYRLDQLRPDRLQLLIDNKKVHADLQQSDVEEILRLEGRRERRANRVRPRRRPHSPKHRDADFFPSRPRRKRKSDPESKPDIHETIHQLKRLAVDIEDCRNEVRQNPSLWQAITDVVNYILDNIGDDAPVKSGPVKSKSTASHTATVH
jgi:hypothetical protein